MKAIKIKQYLLNEILKVEYWIKSINLKKLLPNEKDKYSIKFLRPPWKFISIITTSKSTG